MSANGPEVEQRSRGGVSAGCVLLWVAAIALAVFDFAAYLWTHL